MMAAFDSARFFLHGRLPDISTAAADYIYIDAHMEGEVEEVSGVLGGAITTGDATVTVSVSGTSIGTITVANASSAEGDIDTLNPTSSSRFVSEGDYIKIATDGGSTVAQPWGYSIRIRR